MCTRFIKTAISTAALMLAVATTNAQLHIIANKDNTRPEAALNPISPASNAFTSFTATGYTGYNVINWNGFNEQNVQRYIVEYSTNGNDFQSAGEASVGGTTGYNIRHNINERSPIMYRIRMEMKNGSYTTTDAIFLDGERVSPVTVYPTVVSGNMLNVNADWPVRQINIFSADGAMVFSKNINGQRDFIPVAIPSLGKGAYWVTFYGSTWKSSTKVIVP